MEEEKIKKREIEEHHNKRARLADHEISHHKNNKSIKPFFKRRSSRHTHPSASTPASGP